MFILREINKRSEYNTVLGETYHFIRKETHAEEFEKSINMHIKKAGGAPDERFTAIYAFVVTEKGEYLPLWNNSIDYYIMTASGKTFTNVSY